MQGIYKDNPEPPYYALYREVAGIAAKNEAIRSCIKKMKGAVPCERGR